MLRGFKVILFSVGILLFGCGKEDTNPPKTFDKLLGLTVPFNSFACYDFFYDEENNIITAYNAADQEDFGGSSIARLKIYLKKIDEYGDEVWKRSFETAYESRVYGFTQTMDGGYLLAGLLADQDDLPLEHCAIYLVRTDAEGNKLWEKTYDAFDGSYACQVFEQADGGIAMLVLKQGQTREIFSLDADGNLINEIGGISIFTESIALTENEGFVIAGHGVSRFDALGNIEWINDFDNGSTEEFRSFEKIIPSEDGGFIACGFIFYENGPDPNNDTDYLIVKIDGNGVLQWEVILDDDKRDRGWDMALTPDGNYIFMGIASSGFVDVEFLRVYIFDPEGNQILLKKVEYPYANAIYPSAIQQLDDDYIAIFGVFGNSPIFPTSEMRVRLRKIEK